MVETWDKRQKSVLDPTPRSGWYQSFKTTQNHDQAGLKIPRGPNTRTRLVCSSNVNVQHCYITTLFLGHHSCRRAPTMLEGLYFLLFWWLHKSFTILFVEVRIGNCNCDVAFTVENGSHHQSDTPAISWASPCYYHCSCHLYSRIWNGLVSWSSMSHHPL